MANDGSVSDGDGRVPFGMLVDRRQTGESIPLRILRNGTRRDIEIPLKAYAPGDTRGNLYDQFPRYYVYGGLIFVPLDREMLKTYGAEWFARCGPQPDARVLPPAALSSPGSSSRSGWCCCAGWITR